VNWDDIIIDAAATDTGMRRSNNQDSFMAVRASHEESWRQRGHVFLVADGMGAHAVGELASKMACDLIPHTYMKARTGTPSEAIVKSFREVSAQIHSRASANRDFQGMGTTCSALLLLPAGALVAHVGDSRVYRIRKSRIDQLSFDHSLAWELVRRNHLTSEQASLSVPKNVITRSLGPEVEIEVDIEGPLAVELGDVYLLCSDGLSGPVDDEEMGAFAGNFHPRDACRYLVNLANLRGGLDNITVVIVRLGQWVDPDSGEKSPVPKDERDRSGREGWRSRLAELVKGRRRQGSLHLVEDHPYRTAECVVNEGLIDRLDELCRNIYEQAVAQAWSLDWAALATLRRQAADARARNNHWLSLRKLGEIIAMLGQSARFFRKNAGPASSPVQ
jgi:serine/threonine protein phosphatase PrpC